MYICKYVYVYICTYIYICIILYMYICSYISLSLSLSLSLARARALFLSYNAEAHRHLELAVLPISTFKSTFLFRHLNQHVNHKNFLKSPLTSSNKSGLTIPGMRVRRTLSHPAPKSRRPTLSGPPALPLQEARQRRRQWAFCY